MANICSSSLSQVCWTLKNEIVPKETEKREKNKYKIINLNEKLALLSINTTNEGKHRPNLQSNQLLISPTRESPAGRWWEKQEPDFIAVAITAWVTCPVLCCEWTIIINGFFPRSYPGKLMNGAARPLENRLLVWKMHCKSILECGRAELISLTWENSMENYRTVVSCSDWVFIGANKTIVVSLPLASWKMIKYFQMVNLKNNL